MKMKPFSEPSSYFKQYNISLAGLCATYFDYMLHDGNNIYSDQYRKKENFEIVGIKNATILSL